MIRLNDPERIGPSIADLRLLHQLSQRKLGAQAGITQARLSDWETGNAIPTLPTLVRVAHALGYDLALIPREDAP
jgi:transcriptional regulator with XRE-family HTH domain